MRNIQALLGSDLFDPAELAEQSELSNIECVVKDKSGRDHVLLINVKRVAIKGGTILYSCRDITERKKTEDAVILDLTIPGGMGGSETIRHLKELDPGVSAIAASGYSDDPIITDYMDYGFKGAISKPYRIKSLRAVLHEVLNESQPPALT